MDIVVAVQLERYGMAKYAHALKEQKMLEDFVKQIVRKVN